MVLPPEGAILPLTLALETLFRTSWQAVSSAEKSLEPKPGSPLETTFALLIFHPHPYPLKPHPQHIQPEGKVVSTPRLLRPGIAQYYFVLVD